LDPQTFTKDDVAAAKRLYDAFTNNGLIYNTKDEQFERMELADALSSDDVTRFIPTVVTTIVREALEPAAVVVNNLFQNIKLDRGRQVQIGSIGSMHVADIPEGSEYPEFYPDMDGGNIIAANVGKVGVMIHFTDEMIEDTQFDILGLWLRAAGRAFARHKEKKAIRLLNEMGERVFDNGDPSNSRKGVCTGRDITGAQNGSMTLNDVFEMYAWMVNRGFTPTHWVTHPLAWAMFLTDSEMREVIMEAGTLVTNRLPNGQPSPGWPTEFNGLGQRTKSTGEGEETPNYGPDNAQGKFGANAFFNQELNPFQSTFHIPPRGLPAPLQMVVTPYMEYRTSAGLTTTAADGKSSTMVMMADANATGLLITKESVSIEEFDKPLVDMHGLKLRERYGFIPVEQGKGVTTARGVIIDRNYVFDNVNSVTLAALDDGVSDGSPTFVANV
jgi:hypothetical protein